MGLQFKKIINCHSIGGIVSTSDQKTENLTIQETIKFSFYMSRNLGNFDANFFILKINQFNQIKKIDIVDQENLPACHGAIPHRLVGAKIPAYKKKSNFPIYSDIPQPVKIL